MSDLEPPRLDQLVSIPLGGPAAKLVPIRGHDLEGEELSVDPRGIDHRLLLLFLGSHCDGCSALLPLLADARLSGLDDLKVLALVPGEEFPKGRDLEEFADYAGSVIRSSAAYADYGVLAPPFFALIEPGSSSPALEGVPFGLEDLIAQLQAKA
ncbi:MAG: hypothetical protein NT160_00965 [Actinobacteria bacterium]|nr:hypothetical protein [Actinomycetota bacterium]